MITDIPALIEEIKHKIQNFTDRAVVGLSGGVDSLCVATLCKLALGDQNVVVVHMPYGKTDIQDPTKFNGNSHRIANKLGVGQIHIKINNIVDALNFSVGANVTEDLTELNKGNSRSRVRMCVLYSVAHHLSTKYPDKRVRVMGTGNLSEDFIGYDTKGGDALADIFPIGQLFKSEVYRLADYFAEQGLIDSNMIDRNPSAGLWEGQSDEAELGYTYNQMEPAIRSLLYEENSLEETLKDPLKKFVFRRHQANKHKHEAPPVISLRDKDFIQ